ncbi:hypothetical protein H9P43_009297 [Blastocladiella emersonii ATCC 22665]|nr:hypothetical protein H9P43_009297 [Blastocladiella emersonii ATCC 22665]
MHTKKRTPLAGSGDLALFALLAALTLLSATTTNAAPIDASAPRARLRTLVMFGDSLTDSGNVYTLTNRAWPPAPPLYDNGRFTNGLTWPEYLAEFVESVNADNRTVAVHNYAFGGSTSNDSLVQGYTGARSDIPSPGVDKQLGMFREYMAAQVLKNGGDAAKAGEAMGPTLFTVWTGANDFFFDMQKAAPALVAANVVEAVKQIEHLARNVYKLPRYEIAVLSMPPLGTLPALARLPAAQAVFAQYSLMFNMELFNRLEAINRDYGSRGNVSEGTVPYPLIRLINIHALISAVFASPETFYLPKPVFGSISTPCLEQDLITGAYSLCREPSAHVYHDIYHFSTRIHRIIARAVAGEFLIFVPALSPANPDGTEPATMMSANRTSAAVKPAH